MSHYIHLLPPLLPLEQPLKLDKKRRLRRSRSLRSLSSSDAVEESDEVDEGFAIEPTTPRFAGRRSPIENEEKESLFLTPFNSHTLKAMLQAQEDENDLV